MALECEHYRGFGAVCTTCIELEQAFVNTIAELKRRVMQAEIDLDLFRRTIRDAAEKRSAE